ncbi:MAG: hypothetical protein ACHQVK_02005 [Candidatus Paceibacterales bacterium]
MGITEGEIVHANSLDESGVYAETVHLLEKGYWWPVRKFELAS